MVDLHTLSIGYFVVRDENIFKHEVTPLIDTISSKLSKETEDSREVQPSKETKDARESQLSKESEHSKEAEPPKEAEPSEEPHKESELSEETQSSKETELSKEPCFLKELGFLSKPILELLFKPISEDTTTKEMERISPVMIHSKWINQKQKVRFVAFENNFTLYYEA